MKDNFPVFASWFTSKRHCFAILTSGRPKPKPKPKLYNIFINVRFYWKFASFIMRYNVCSSSIQASKMFVKLGVNFLMASFSYFLGSVLPWAPHTSQLYGIKKEIGYQNVFGYRNSWKLVNFKITVWNPDPFLNFRTKNKISTYKPCLGQHPQFYYPFLGQRTKWTPSCFKVINWQLQLRTFTL